MKSFFEFFSNEYLALESIEYLDRTIFKRLINKDKSFFDPSKIIAQDIEQIQNLQDIQDFNGFESQKYNKDKKYLDKDQEIRLLKIYKENPYSQEGLQARNKIIQSKLKYIYAICRRLVNQERIRQEDFDDAVQEGVRGLVKAIDKADIQKLEKDGRGFTPYASSYISGYASNAFNSIRQKDIDSGRFGQVQSLDAEISGDRGEWADKDQTMADKVPDYSHTPGQDMRDDEQRILFREFMRLLPDKERRAIEMYYPPRKEDQKTFEQIGAQLGVSKPGAKMIVDRAVSKLKQFAREYEENGSTSQE